MSKSIKTIHRAIELGLNLFDTSDAYSAGKNEQLVGEGIKGRRDKVIIASQVRQRARPQRRARRRQRQAGLRAGGLRGESEAARHRRDRSLLHPPHRQGRADRGDGRRHVAARRAGQGALPRPVRGRRGHHPPRPQDASDHRAGDRVLALDPRHRGRDPADAARARHRAGGLLPARPRLPVRRVPEARRPDRGRPPARPSALHGGQFREEPQAAPGDRTQSRRPPA